MFCEIAHNDALPAGLLLSCFTTYKYTLFAT